MADCLRSLKIDDQLKIGRLLDRKVGGVVSAEYLDGESRALTPDLRETRPVSQETARLRRFGPVVNRGQPRCRSALDVVAVNRKNSDDARKACILLSKQELRQGFDASHPQMAGDANVKSLLPARP